MVIPLRPGKFYGSSLPRPRIYTNVKYSHDRVDPPVSVVDPILSWANEAHWSMGGLSLKRVRLQGKIEGNVEKLRKEKEKVFKKRAQDSTPVFDDPPPAPSSKNLKLWSKWVDEEEEVDSVDEEEEEDGLGSRKSGVARKRRRLVRKLGDDFEMVANDNGGSNRRSPLKDVSNGGGSIGVASRTRGSRGRRRSMILMDEDEDEEDVEGGGLSKSKQVKVEKNVGEKGSVSINGKRSSPRLKQKSS